MEYNLSKGLDMKIKYYLTMLLTIPTLSFATTCSSSQIVDQHYGYIGCFISITYNNGKIQTKTLKIPYEDCNNYCANNQERCEQNQDIISNTWIDSLNVRDLNSSAIIQNVKNLLSTILNYEFVIPQFSPSTKTFISGGPAYYNINDKKVYINPEIFTYFSNFGISNLTDQLKAAIIILAHELTHAAQHQMNLLRDLKSKEFRDFIIEGHAVFIQDIFSEFLGLEKINELGKKIIINPKFSKNYNENEYTRIQGAKFFDYIYRKQGPKAVINVFYNPPLSKEETLYPSIYLKRIEEGL